MTQEQRFDSVLIKHALRHLFNDDSVRDVIKDLRKCSSKHNKCKRLSRKNIVSDFSHFADRLEILMENNNEQT